MLWHVIMTPLTTLVATAEMLQVETEQEPSPVPSDTRALLRQTVETASQLERLVTDALGFFRLQIPPTLVTVDLDALAAEVVAGLPVAAWHDAMIDVARLPAVSGDPARLRLLFRQLFEAAHRSRGPDLLVVTVWAVVYEDTVRVSVADNGIGGPVNDAPTTGTDVSDVRLPIAHAGE
jgi:signal transduction histidine kinase